MATGYSFHVSPPTTSPAPVQDEEFYSSWSLFLVCMLLILSLWTSYYLQIKRIRAIHETLVSVFAGMFVGLVVRLAPGTMIREMLVSVFSISKDGRLTYCTCMIIDIQAHPVLQSAATSHHPELRIRAQAGEFLVDHHTFLT